MDTKDVLAYFNSLDFRIICNVSEETNKLIDRTLDSTKALFPEGQKNLATQSLLVDLGISILCKEYNEKGITSQLGRAIQQIILNLPKEVRVYLNTKIEQLSITGTKSWNVEEKITVEEGIQGQELLLISPMLGVEKTLSANVADFLAARKEILTKLHSRASGRGQISKPLHSYVRGKRVSEESFSKHLQNLQPINLNLYDEEREVFSPQVDEHHTTFKAVRIKLNPTTKQWQFIGYTEPKYITTKN